MAIENGVKVNNLLEETTVESTDNLIIQRGTAIPKKITAATLFENVPGDLDVSGSASFGGVVNANGFQSLDTTNYNFIARNTGTALYVNRGDTSGNIAAFKYNSLAAGVGTDAFLVNVGGVEVNGTVVASGTVTADAFNVAGVSGVSGSFTSSDGKTITVNNGIITGIV